jgi:hypothetical protein
VEEFDDRNEVATRYRRRQSSKAERTVQKVAPLSTHPEHKEPTMKIALSLIPLLGLAVSACSDASNSLTAPDNLQPNYSCAGQSGNCGGGNHNNNPNNPPTTAP